MPLSLNVKLQSVSLEALFLKTLKMDLKYIIGLYFFIFL